MVIVEKSFPRGGVAPPTTATAAEPSENIIFGALQRKKKSEPKERVKKSVDVQDGEGEDHIEVASAALINHQSIQDGMLIMGIVRSVDQISVKISLPGRISVKVLALSISDSYTKNVAEFVANPDAVENYKPLTEMFREGQIVYGKVMDVKQLDTGRTDISFSLKPSDVHSELVHSQIKKGFVFNGAVEEVQEHGYIIETGIRRLRCFLPLEKSRPGHAVGELIFMKVDELNAHPSVTTIRCKEVNESNLKIKDQIDPNLDYLLPGGVVGFTVTKCLKDGLQGTLMNGVFTGYVNEHNLQKALSSLDDVSINSTLNARILYVAPLTKFVYLSLNLFQSDEQSTAYQKGDIVQNAAVHHMSSGGIIMILDNKYKGVITLRTLKLNNTGNYDMDQILNKYTKKSKHPVRILDYDLVGGFFVCTDDPAAVNEKVFTVNDIAVGDFCTASVVEKNKKIGGYTLMIGKVNGLIDKFFLSPTTNALGERAKLKCRIIAKNTARNIAYVTNLPEYMAKDSKVLTSLKDAHVNSTYLGTIVKCEEHFFLVKFFNDIKGVLYRTRTNGVTNFYEGQSMYFRIISRNDENIVLALPEDTFEIGEFCRAKVTHVLDTGMEILVESKENDTFTLKAFVPERLVSEFTDLASVKLKTFSIGQDVVACCISKNVFSVRDVPYFEDGAVEWKNVQVGDVYRAFIKNVEGNVIELVVPIKKFKKTVKIHRDMLVTSSTKQTSIVLEPEQVVYVKILSKDTPTKTIGVSAKLLDVWDGNLIESGLHFAKYLSEIWEIKKSLKALGKPISKLTIGGKVSAVFQGVNEETGDWGFELEKYKVVGIIKKHLQGKQKALTEGESVECVVLWVDYKNEVAYLSCNPVDKGKINNDKQLPENLVNKTGINAKAILKLDNAILCSLKKGTNPLVFIPTRLNYNDFEGASTGNLSEGDFCKLSFIHETLPIAVLDDTYRVWKDVQKNKRKLEELLQEVPEQPKPKKRKLEHEEAAQSKDNKQTKNKTKEKKGKAEKEKVMFYEDRVPSTTNSDRKPAAVKPNKRTLEENKTPLKDETMQAKKAKQTKKEAKSKKEIAEKEPVMFYEDRVPLAVDSDEESVPAKPRKRTLDETRTPLQVKKTTESVKPKSTEKKSAPQPTEVKLPGASNFWSTNLSDIVTRNNAESSSEDEEEPEDENAVKKKKKLTASEKFKAEREEESRLTAIEEKLANPNILPETSDQFDRLVLSDPNNSKHWINYMVFHLQAMEIDRARGVARRALKSISFRESVELMNIWIAMLNMELRYGTKESFSDVLNEALLNNDQCKIYMRVLEMYADTNKTQELVELIGTVTKKFKDSLEMWKSCAIAFYKVGIHDRAQQMMNKALAVLPEREHVNTIVAFANLTHKYAKNPETAHVLLDQVVTSYPKRVDVWSQLVDMLIKDNQIESARRTLERAIVQKIPFKKMRTIFKKYMEFEENHGTPEDVEKVKALAEEYIKKNLP